MDDYLAQHPSFRSLSPSDRERFGKSFVLKDFGRGQNIFTEGDGPAAVFLLREGLVKAVKYSPSSEPFTLEIIVPGHLFGVIAVMDRKAYPVTTVAVRESRAYGIPAKDFEALMQHPDFARAVYSEVGSHVRHSQDMRSLAKEPVEKRIAYILVLLHDALGTDLDLRREDIAEMTSCTPETAIRTLADFKKLGLIDTGWKHVRILDRTRLQNLSGVE